MSGTSSVRVRVVVAWLVVGAVLATAVTAGWGATAVGAGAEPVVRHGAVPATLGQPDLVGQEQPETDTTLTRVDLEPDGDGRWRVHVRTRLATEEDAEAFRAFQDEFRQNTSRYLDPFRERIRNVVAGAAEETGRSMRAENFSASTSVQEVPRRWGVVTYEFTWTNVARTDGDALEVGDVFVGGFFLAENDSFAVAGPSGYRVAEADPAPEESGDGTVTWSGRRDFTDRRPHARFEPAQGTDSPTAEPGSGSDGTPDLGTVMALGLGGVLVAGALFGLYRYRDDGDADPGIVTDEDRVRELLEEHGGQVKQAAVAETFDWSASKTSRVLSRMADDGEIEKLRIGRENVIRWSDDE